MLPAVAGQPQNFLGTCEIADVFQVVGVRDRTRSVTRGDAPLRNGAPPRLSLPASTGDKQDLFWRPPTRSPLG